MAKFTGQTPAFKGQCEAQKRDGTRCGKHALAGGNVCRLHGGAAPQVQEANRVRLARLVSPAIAKLEEAVKAKKGDKDIPYNLQISAAKESLHLNGYKAKDEIVVTQTFDHTRFAAMSDAEIQQFIALGRKLTAATDARESSADT